MPILRKRAGFTLVEMLVVISIIGVLIGLMLPAINAVRERGRRTQCVNNQRNIGIALIAYENSKGRLPGVLNRVDPTNVISPQTNWVMALFGDLNRGDLMDYWRGGVNPSNPGQLQGVKVDVLICPSNKQIEPVGGLSYVVNMGIYSIPAPATPNYAIRLFRNRATVENNAPKPEPDLSFVSLKSSAQTILLSESLNAGPWTFIPSNSGQPGLFNPALSTLAFIWPLDTNPGSTLPSPEVLSSSIPGLSSNHGGTIVVTFCDGHTETPVEGTACYRDPNITIYGTP
ncbi:MAG: DUF1559 domain-containing protein [Pirellulales bacterium]|nr:DUF1559 domain-containing protein [Pirellulales bacterium]